MDNILPTLIEMVKRIYTIKFTNCFDKWNNLETCILVFVIKVVKRITQACDLAPWVEAGEPGGIGSIQ